MNSYSLQVSCPVPICNDASDCIILHTLHVHRIMNTCAIGYSCMAASSTFRFHVLIHVWLFSIEIVASIYWWKTCKRIYMTVSNSHFHRVLQRAHPHWLCNPQHCYTVKPGSQYDARASVAPRASGLRWNRLDFYSSVALRVLASVQPIRLLKNLTSGMQFDWWKKDFFLWRSRRSWRQRHIVNQALCRDGYVKSV